MRGWIPQLNNATCTFGYYLSIDNHDGTERCLTLILKRSARYLYRLFQEVLIDVTEWRGH